MSGELDSSVSGLSPPTKGCVLDSKASHSIEDRLFLEQLSDYRILKKDPNQTTSLES
jgi:hypothetical protein